jgi:hypothetical protein
MVVPYAQVKNLASGKATILKQFTLECAFADYWASYVYSLSHEDQKMMYDLNKKPRDNFNMI